jgi:F-type H+-transporting ATPase subunit epsilon
MYLEIITPDNKLFEGEVDLVKLPGVTGSFEILMNHAPLISTLMEGKIKVKESNGKITWFGITGGVAQVKNSNIIVLVDSSGIS